MNLPQNRRELIARELDEVPDLISNYQAGFTEVLPSNTPFSDNLLVGWRLVTEQAYHCLRVNQE